MNYIAIDLWNSPYLDHHGVKGMKWGVRHDYKPKGRHSSRIGIDYVLKENPWPETRKLYEKDPSDLRRKVRVSKEAYKNEKTYKVKLGRSIALGTLAVAGGIGLMALANNSDDYSLASNAANAILFGTGAVVLGGLNLNRQLKAENNEKQYFKNREKTSVFDKSTGLYKKTRKESRESDCAKVNPGFKRSNSNYTTNCVLCTVTYDLRRRGYDVTAGVSATGHDQKDVNRIYPDAKIVEIDGATSDGKYSSDKARKNLLNELKKQPNSRGDITMRWPIGGGHSVAYEVDKSGKVTVLDTQANRIYKNPNELLNYASAYSYARFDNIQPDYNVIRKYGVVR